MTRCMITPSGLSSREGAKSIFYTLLGIDVDAKTRRVFGRLRGGVVAW